MEIVREIENCAKGANDKPIEDVVIDDCGDYNVDEDDDDTVDDSDDA